LTPRRYDAYRRICTELDRLSAEALADGERELLRDVAEGLLLARHGTDDEVEELRSKAAVALSLLVGLGRWSDAAADEVWERLVACGPLATGGPRLPRAVQHA
jgi:hypothetical protein